MEEEIDAEIERYEQISADIDKVSADISESMQTYKELMNLYMFARISIEKKTNEWRVPRLEKWNSTNARFQSKWKSLQDLSQVDPELYNQERRYLALLKMYYKKQADLKAKLKSRETAIRAIVKEAFSFE